MAEGGVPGGRGRHRKAKHCGCRGRDPLVLEGVSELLYSVSIDVDGQRTSLETRYWRRDLDTASKEIGKTGKDSEQQEAEGRSTSKKECSLLVDSHAWRDSQDLR